MQTPLKITFHGIEHSDFIESYVRTRAAKLETFSKRIQRCHVTIETPHRNKRHGNHHRVRVDITVPGAELVVARDPAERRANEDLYASIDAAFEHACRVVHDHASIRRRQARAQTLPGEGDTLARTLLGSRA